MKRGTAGQKAAPVSNSPWERIEAARLARLAGGDPNAAFETNEEDAADLAAGGDGIVYAANAAEAEEIRQLVRRSLQAGTRQ